MKEIIVSKNDPIRFVMSVIDQGNLRTAVVLDDDKLVGIVTDGDIRRGLLNDIQLTEPINRIMNDRPIVAYVTDIKSRQLDLMQKNDLHCLPIVDHDRRLISIETRRDLGALRFFGNPVFIMAGGFGSRLKPLTDECPKPMLDIGGKPLLARAIELYKEQGFFNFYISVHYLPEIIKEFFGNGSKFGVSINYVDETNPLGTGGALALLPKELPHLPIIMINGDVMTNIGLEELLLAHQEMDNGITIAVKDVEYKISYGVITLDKLKHVISVDEKPVFRHQINCGIYVINHDLILTKSPIARLDMPNFISQKIGSGTQVGVYRFDDYWLDIGQLDDYSKAQLDYNSVYR